MTGAVGQANAEGSDCTEPTPRERKLLCAKKLEEWKRDRRKEAASHGEQVTHSVLVVTDDGHAVVQEQARTSGGCQSRYLRVSVSTSACDSDFLNEEEFYVGCCVPRGCSASPASWAHAFVDAATLEQAAAVRRFIPEAGAMTVTDAQGRISPYRRTDAPARYKEMMKSLPYWTPTGDVTCSQPKHASGKFESDCSFSGDTASYRFTLSSSGGDLADDKNAWFVTRVQIDAH